MQVGAAGRFADGVKIQPPQFGLQGVDFRKVRSAFPQPLGQTWDRGPARLELNQRIGRQLVFSHDRIFETRSFELRSGLGLRSGILERADQDAKVSFLGSRGDNGVHALLIESLGHNLGVRPSGGNYLPIIAR